MFRTLAKKVFNSSSKREFYSSILANEQNLFKKDTIEPIPTRQADSEPVTNLTPEQMLTEHYYDFLFGKADQNIKSDDLSLYISEQVKMLLLKPESILENMPVLPASLTQVLPHIRNKDFDAQHLVGLLNQEPVVAARVVELANSNRYNRTSKQVTDLKSAFLMLGVQGLSEGVINGFIHKLIPQNTLYFSFYGKRIWESSLLTGHLTRSLLLKSEHAIHSDEGYLLGLISNLGDIVIYQLMADAFNLVHPDCQPNSLLFRDLLKTNAKQFSATLTKSWNFPKLLTDSLTLQTQINSSKQARANLHKYPLAIYLYEAKLLANLKLQMKYGQLSKEQLLGKTRQLSLSSEAEFAIEDMLNEQGMLVAS